LEDILRRFWGNLIGRATGPINFRLVIQPTVASILAIRAGIKDAREGRPAFLWAAIRNPAYRPELLRQGWRDVEKVFLIAAVLDAIYQLIVHRGVFLLELVVVATVLAIVPYVMIRGPVSRIAAMMLRQRRDREARPEVDLDGEKQFEGERHHER
jgi:hypothetical protein